MKTVENGVKLFIEKAIAAAISVLIIFSGTVANCVGFTVSAVNYSGSGTQNNPYIIITAEQLAGITSKGLDKCYKLANDIKLPSNTNWVPIGSNSGKFCGIFDGDGHSVTGLNISDCSSVNSGLFGFVGSQGIIKNVGIIGAKIVSGCDYVNVGSLAGDSSGVIADCYEIDSSISCGIGANAGGLLGHNSGTVISCYAVTKSISQRDNSANIGNLIGDSEGKVNNCYWNQDTNITAGIGNCVAEINKSNGLGTSDMKSAALINALNAAHNDVLIKSKSLKCWALDSATKNSGYPILINQVLTNAAAPTITTQPVSKSVNIGDTVTLSVTANGNKLSYQWYKNTVDSTEGYTAISGATSSAYDAPTSTAGTTYYYCVVTNTDDTATGNKTATAKTQTATVTVEAPTPTPTPIQTPTNAAAPTITTQPVSKSVDVGDMVTLSVTANGNKLSYQWYKNTVDSTEGYTAISGAISSTYDVPTTESGTTYYYCVITSTDDTATGNKTATAKTQTATVTVEAPSPIPTPNPIPVQTPTNAAAPTITTQPVSKSVDVGDRVTLSVTANGNKLSYQWYSGDTAISGAISSAYDVPTSTAGTTYYYCVVTNTDDTATGNKTATATTQTATVTVEAQAPTPTPTPIPVQTPTNAATPVITAQPVPRLVSVGDTVTLSVTAEGDKLSYQWYNGDTAISGATSSAYDVPTSISGTAYYYCVVTSTDDTATGSKTATATTQTAAVTVNDVVNAKAPEIISQPVSKTVNLGGIATLSVTARGDNLNYQWYSGNDPISGAIDSTYNAPTLTAVTTYYYCVVTSTDDAATGSKTATAKTQTVTVTVNAVAVTPKVSAPSNKTVSVGKTAAFSVAAVISDGGILKYQWQISIDGGNCWSDISCANDSVYSTGAVLKSNSGTLYRCVVTNSINDTTATATSCAATLTVQIPAVSTTYIGSSMIAKGAANFEGNKAKITAAVSKSMRQGKINNPDTGGELPFSAQIFFLLGIDIIAFTVIVCLKHRKVGNKL